MPESVGLGSKSLNSLPNLLTSYSIVADIEEMLEPDRCDRSSQGADYYVETAHIDYDDYDQNGRAAQALLDTYNFRVLLPEGPSRGKILSVSVPAGFVTDLYSKPDFARPLTRSTKKALSASIIHDWLYAVGEAGNKKQRAIADQALLGIMKFYEVEERDAWFVNWAVRNFGSKPFGDWEELRFYNKCYFGKCLEPIPYQLAWLRESPVAAPDPDPELRAQLWALTVCIVGVSEVSS
ncbi:DUF1353 domain-containing protein [Henriciella sp. AS95]|uniref:DUF1353 domain-containing protein n=1 Tax=Henriciella sp. AS95 TaxID=3135782 RepID=UPI00316BE85B